MLHQAGLVRSVLDLPKTVWGHKFGFPVETLCGYTVGLDLPAFTTPGGQRQIGNLGGFAAKFRCVPTAEVKFRARVSRPSTGEDKSKEAWQLREVAT